MKSSDSTEALALGQFVEAFANINIPPILNEILEWVHQRLAMADSGFERPDSDTPGRFVRDQVVGFHRSFAFEHKNPLDYSFDAFLPLVDVMGRDDFQSSAQDPKEFCFVGNGSSVYIGKLRPPPSWSVIDYYEYHYASLILLDDELFAALRLATDQSNSAFSMPTKSDLESVRNRASLFSLEHKARLVAMAPSAVQMWTQMESQWFTVELAAC